MKKSTVTQRVKELIDNQRVSVRWVEQEIGITETRLSKMIREDRDIPAGIVLKIFDLWGNISHGLKYYVFTGIRVKDPLVEWHPTEEDKHRAFIDNTKDDLLLPKRVEELESELDSINQRIDFLFREVSKKSKPDQT